MPQVRNELACVAGWPPQHPPLTQPFASGVCHLQFAFGPSGPRRCHHLRALDQRAEPSATVSTRAGTAGLYGAQGAESVEVTLCSHLPPQAELVHCVVLSGITVESILFS